MAVLLFPELSVTVKVTVLAPTLAQVKLLGETLIESIPEASVDPSSTCALVMTTVPDEFN